MTQPCGDWRDIFRAFRMMLDVRKFWLALRGLLLSILLVGATVGSIACVEDVLNIRFSMEDEIGSDGKPTGHIAVSRRTLTEMEWPAVKYVFETEVTDAILGLNPSVAVYRTAQFARAVAWSAWSEVRRYGVIEGRSYWNVSDLLTRSTSLMEIIALAVANCILLLLVWSYYGGAIMRIAAVEYAAGERIESSSATAYTWRKHGVLFGSPFGVVLGMAVLGLAIAFIGALAWNVLVVAVAVGGLLLASLAGGLVQDSARSGKAGLAAGAAVVACTIGACTWLALSGTRIPHVGEVLVGLLSPVAMLLGVVIVLLGLWVVFGWCLMFGTVVSEDSDSFQAWSRSLAMLCRQPWRYFGYLALTVAYAGVCLGALFWIRHAAEATALACLSPGVADKAEAAYRTIVTSTIVGDAGARMLTILLQASRLLLDLAFLALAVAFILSARTVAYFLLRKYAEGRPIDEVHLEPDDRDLLLEAPAESE